MLKSGAQKFEEAYPKFLLSLEIFFKSARELVH